MRRRSRKIPVQPVAKMLIQGISATIAPLLIPIAARICCTTCNAFHKHVELHLPYNREERHPVKNPVSARVEQAFMPA
jgi:hypothetical protein